MTYKKSVFALQYTATKRVAWHCNTLQQKIHCMSHGMHVVRARHTRGVCWHCNTLQHTATHCNPLQHTATHCNNTLNESRHTRGVCWHCNTLQHKRKRWKCTTLQQHTASTHCNNTLQQHTATHCNNTLNASWHRKRVHRPAPPLQERHDSFKRRPMSHSTQEEYTYLHRLQIREGVYL